jgi:hypothetical protein
MQRQTIDPKYLRLYQEYSSAIRAFENATKDRSRVRSQLKRQRTASPKPRRPVGSPRDFRIPENVRPATRQATPAPAKKIYLGKILGWAKIIYTTAPSVASSDPTRLIDPNKTHEAISLQMYWNAKNRYESSRQAFFDYVRRRNIEVHRGRAKQALSHAANLQILGAEGADEAAWEEAKLEVEKACQNAWAIYQGSPSPKTDEMKILLLESCADAQAIGLDGSHILQTMEVEMLRAFNAGELTMVEK